jgi:hypothetical protein
MHDCGVACRKFHGLLEGGSSGGGSPHHVPAWLERQWSTMSFNTVARNDDVYARVFLWFDVDRQPAELWS